MNSALDKVIEYIDYQQVELIAEAKQELSDLRKENESASNLLAIIHRDGGHYQTKHGTVKSIKDAIKIWHDLRNQLEQANEDAERLNEHLGHGMGCISWYNPMRCDCGCQDARKAHEERIT